MKNLKSITNKSQYIMQHDKLLFSSDDGITIGVLWNNITGKNFKGKDVDGSHKEDQYIPYLDMLKKTAGLPSGYIQLYEKKGKMSEEFCVPHSQDLEIYKKETVNQGRSILFIEANEFSEVFVEDKNGKHSYGFPKNSKYNPTPAALSKINSWHVVKDMGYSYYFDVIDWEEGFTAIFVKADQIIASTLLAIVPTSTVPKDEEKLEEEEEIIIEEKVEPLESTTSENTATNVFKNCTLDVQNNTIILPKTKVDRKLYEKVKSILEVNGGTYKGGKIQGFVFKSNPSSILERLQGGEEVNDKKKFQFFATQENEINQMIERLNLKSTDEVLEPSAGQGHIVDKIKHLVKKVDMCELMPENREVLNEKGYYICEKDFLALNEERKYDKIIANPPFTKNQDIDHVLKMYRHLKPKGRLVSIMSTTWLHGTQKKQNAFKEFLKEVGAKIEHIEEGAFKKSGTNIKTVMVTINKK